MLILSDIHGAFRALADVAASGETLLILGDLINLTDYRTGEGITADLLGIDFARSVARARAAGDFAEMRRLWVDEVGDDWESFRARYAEQVAEQYAGAAEALDGATGYATFGNVDRPALMRQTLPPGIRFVDGERVEIDGLAFGFVGGGVSTPLRAEGEVTDDEMRRKLEALGPVDVLCSHLPPAIEPLHTDVITGMPERASVPILEYLLEHRPRLHFFGDVHQPQAIVWRVGTTLCRNVGYFRATRRPFRFDPVGS